MSSSREAAGGMGVVEELEPGNPGGDDIVGRVTAAFRRRDSTSSIRVESEASGFSASANK
jgi:hypothetical protein